MNAAHRGAPPWTTFGGEGAFGYTKGGRASISISDQPLGEKCMRRVRMGAVACILLAAWICVSNDARGAKTRRTRAEGGARSIALASTSDLPSGGLASAGATANAVAVDDDVSLTPFYAQTSWPALHRDSSNSDFVPYVAPSASHVKWTALDGAAVLVAPTIGPEGNLYVTTGQGPGMSHLHAFDRDGNLLWESPPQQTLDDLDSMAVGSAPAVDRDGDLYVSDSNQFWAFHSNGALKWVVNLPEPNRPFVSTVITREGYVGGITTGGKVMFVRRGDGLPAARVSDLPGGPGPVGPVVPPGLWEGGLMDPAIIQRAYHSFFGYEGEVTNTPAISFTTGRLFITAAGAERTAGVLYGLDLVNGAWSIAFATAIGAGSGASPSISPDGKHVYAVGGDHVMVAIDAETGDPLWRVGDSGAAASPAVGPDGTIYTGSGEFLAAIRPGDGSNKWRVDFNVLAGAFLQTYPAVSPFFTGIPIGRVNSVVTVTPTHLLVAVVLGYGIELPNSGPTPPQPRYTVLCSIDPSDGSVISTTTVRDTSEAVVSVGMDGRLYFSHGAILSSIAYYGVNPVLPPRLRIDGPPPGGLSVLEPDSLLHLTTGGIQWAESLGARARGELPDGNLIAASDRLRRARAQLVATAGTVVTDAVGAGELDARIADVAQVLMLAASNHLAIAEERLGIDSAQAIAPINLAEGELDDALTLLGSLSFLQLDVLTGEFPSQLSVQLGPKDRIEIAVIGMLGFDTTRINDSSVLLQRADGIGGAVGPMRIARGTVGQSTDVAGPGAGGDCAYPTAGADGVVDRVFSFSAAETVDELALGSAGPEGVVPLKLTGTLDDGTSFRATGCVAASIRSLAGHDK